ncbi:MAG: HNH endonuclease family protein [Caldimonas sp.]
MQTLLQRRRRFRPIKPAGDAEFENAFKTARVSKCHLARYYLSALENQSKGTGHPELVPNKNVNAVNLEHVLPENPQGEWPGLSSDVCAAYYRRIGNMALLAAVSNSKIGNLGFAKRKPTLVSSSFQLTKQIGLGSSWGPGEIEKRQAELAK